ncbi:MAG: hypothetical protein DRN29_08420 [Thermoplasmata archaeon]|nr:MAG: hypothetical protein DRN29_08420 [Thermoplasmata archaeon]
MACFLVPGAEAVVTTVVQKVIGEEKAKKLKLGWLNTMLWGGVILLAIEHIWHGEIVPWPPFLTAMKNPAEIPVMLHEMALVGGIMCIVITLAWILLVAISSLLHEKVASRKAVRI